jgi:hypothetical protein
VVTTNDVNVEELSHKEVSASDALGTPGEAGTLPG